MERRVIRTIDWASIIGLIAILVSLWINSAQQRQAIQDLALQHALEWGNMQAKVDNIDRKVNMLSCKVFTECGDGNSGTGSK